ncbi:MAG: hypothetical protein R3E63_02240 [Pseudomonadales bacterium]
MINLTDSLALFDLLGTLDESLSVPEFNTIFHTSSNDMDSTRERMLDAVQEIFGISNSQ